MRSSANAGYGTGKRYQAIRLLAQGQTPVEVATAVRCRVSPVHNWVGVWRQQGSVGLHEEHHSGRAPQMDAPGIHQLETLLAADPHELGEQETDWTAPLLLSHLSRAGYTVSTHTLRQTLHRLSWRLKRPRYELGRPDPAYAEGKKRWWSQ